MEEDEDVQMAEQLQPQIPENEDGQIADEFLLVSYRTITSITISPCCKKNDRSYS